MKNFNLLFLLFSILLLSCSNLAWKKTFVYKRQKEFTEKYKIPEDFEFNIPQNIELSTKPLKKINRKELKKNFQFFEMICGTIPDSTSINNGKVDSFYYNPYKINYIVKNNLKSNSIHFMND